jgi:hypothetical protein
MNMVRDRVKACPCPIFELRASDDGEKSSVDVDVEGSEDTETDAARPKELALFGFDGEKGIEHREPRIVNIDSAERVEAASI